MCSWRSRLVLNQVRQRPLTLNPYIYHHKLKIFTCEENMQKWMAFGKHHQAQSKAEIEANVQMDGYIRLRMSETGKYYIG